MSCDYLQHVALHGEQEVLVQLLAFPARVLAMTQIDSVHVLHVTEIHHKPIRVELPFHGHLRDYNNEQSENRNMIVVSVKRLAKTLFLTSCHTQPTL